MMSLANLQNSLTDVFYGKFSDTSKYALKCSYNKLETRKLLGTWNLLHSTSEENSDTVHIFLLKNKSVFHIIDQGETKVENAVTFDHVDGYARIVSSSEAHYILAIYDKFGKCITDSNNSDYGYIVMGAYNENPDKLTNSPVYLLGIRVC